ncbi:MAG: transposase [Pseudonocardiaceae bacterium]
MPDTSAGHRHDSLAFEAVMAGIRIRRRGRGRPRTRPAQMLGDKAYSSRTIRSHLRRRRIKATIPEPADQRANRLRRGSRSGRPPKFDPESYKLRNVVERAINKLKGRRAVATRYDKRDYMFRGTMRSYAGSSWTSVRCRGPDSSSYSRRGAPRLHPHHRCPRGHRLGGVRAN